MKIVLTFNKLKVTLEAEGVESSLDAIIVTNGILTETRKLNYGSPTVEMNTEDLKVEPNPTT